MVGGPDLVRLHTQLLEKLSGEKGRLSAVVNENILRLLKLLKGVGKVSESSIVESALLLYFFHVWDSLDEDKKTGLKLLLGSDEIFSLGLELKKTIEEKKLE